MEGCRKAKTWKWEGDRQDSTRSKAWLEVNKLMVEAERKEEVWVITRFGGQGERWCSSPKAGVWRSGIMVDIKTYWFGGGLWDIQVRHTKGSWLCGSKPQRESLYGDFHHLL